jgi:hypothetical protein
MLEDMLDGSKRFERFKQTWKEQIKKIENEVLDTRAVWNVYKCFQYDERVLFDSIQVLDLMKISQEISLLDSKLVIALETARTKYSLQNKTLWVRVIEGISKIVYRMPQSIEFKPNSSSSQAT